MFKNIISTIDGMHIWPIVATIMFFICFVYVLVWTLKLDKKFVNHMSSLPLDNDNLNMGEGNNG